MDPWTTADGGLSGRIPSNENYEFQGKENSIDDRRSVEFGPRKQQGRSI